MNSTKQDVENILKLAYPDKSIQQYWLKAGELCLCGNLNSECTKPLCVAAYILNE